MVEMVNPYIAGAPVTEKRMFFGREDVFQWITNSLSGQYADHILVIHGQRRVGKTSVLKQLGNRLPPRYIPVFFDLQGRTHTTFDRFLWWLAREISRVLKQERNIDIPVPEKEVFTSDLEYFDNHFLGEVNAALPGQTLLLTFDEFDNLEETEVKEELARPLVDYLRQMMGREGLNFIFSIGSSGRKLENMQAAYTDFFKSALYKKISFLSEEQAHKLITDPVAGVIEYERAAVERIYAITSGHPYFTQLVCHELFSRCQRTELRSVARLDVEAILDDVVERGTVNLKFVWDEASDLEKWSLAALAQLEKADIHTLAEHLRKNRVRFSDNDLNSSLLHLREKDVLTRENRFVIHLLRLWLQKNRPMDQVREELTEVNPIANRYIEIGLEFKDSGQYTKAIESFQEALAIAKENVQAQVSIGLVYMDQKSYEKAILEFEKALVMDDEDVSAVAGLCEAHLALGDAAFAGKRTREAVQSYQRVLEINAEHTEARQRMAEITRQRAEKALQEGKEEEALAIFTEALKYSPEDRDLINRLDQVRAENKGKILARLMNRAGKELSAKNWATALKTLEEASLLAPGDASITKKVSETRQKVAEERTSIDLARADAATRNKNWEEAEAILISLQAERPGLEIQAKLDDLLVQKRAAQLSGIKTRAAALTRLEKYDEALQAWEEYLNRAPDDRVEAEDAIQRIRAISNLARDYSDAQEAIRRKHYGRAIELLQGIIARDPMYKATSRLLAEAVQANRSNPFWKRGWVWGVLGTLGVAALVVMGIFFGPGLWTNISAVFQKTPTTGTSQDLPSRESILAYMAENQGFLEDFSGPEYAFSQLAEGVTVSEYVQDGILKMPLKVGTPGEKLGLSGNWMESTNFSMEFDYYWESNSGVSLIGFGFPNTGDGSKLNTDFYIEWDEANLAKFSWFAGLSDRSIDHRGKFDPNHQGKWHTLRVLYYCTRLVVYVDDDELHTIDGLGRSTQTTWIVAATNAEASIWLDNVKFWNLDSFITCPASSALPTVTALTTAQPTQEARSLNPANGHYYQYMDFSKSWHDAVDNCKQRGAHLVTVQDGAENLFLVDIAQGNPVWLGATDEAEEGNWAWVTAEPWSEANWDTGEPSNSFSGEHYLSSTIGKWNDLPVSEQLYFVCEWEPEVDTSFYSSIQSYITVQPPTFEDDFSSPRPVWGKTNKGLPVDSFVADGVLAVDNICGPECDSNPDLAAGVVSFPANGMLDAANLAMQFKFSFESAAAGASHMGVQFRAYEFFFKPAGKNLDWGLYHKGTTKTLLDSGTLQPDPLPANTLLVVVYQGYLLIYLDGNLVVARDGISEQLGPVSIFFGDDGASMIFDDLKFWNLDEMSLFAPTATPAFQGSATFTNIQAYISQNSPTFEDDFSTPDVVWGGTDEELLIYPFVADGVLTIEDHAPGGGTHPGDVPGVLFPVNGLLDASDFALQVKYKFERLSKVGLQFRSTAKMNSGSRFVFTPGSWDLYIDNTWITGGWWTLNTDFQEALLIVKGDSFALFMNRTVIYEGTIPTSSETGNQIIASGNHGSYGLFDEVKFWNMDGAEIENLPGSSNSTGASFYETIQSYITEKSPTFMDSFSIAKPDWGLNSEGINVTNSYTYGGQLHIRENIKQNYGGYVDYISPGLSFPTNGLLDAADFAIQFDVDLGTLDTMGLLFRSAENVNNGYLFEISKVSTWYLKSAADGKVIAADKYEGGFGEYTLLIVAKGADLAISINGNVIYQGIIGAGAGTSNRISIFGTEDLQQGQIDNFKFWNLEGAEIEALAVTPTLTPASQDRQTLLRIQDYITDHSPTFEDNFEPIKFGWGNNSELMGLFDHVKNGVLEIEDNNKPDAGVNPYGPDYRIPGVSFPINGLFDANDFSLQFNFDFYTLAEVRIQFRSTNKLDTGYRITFFSGNQWDLKSYPGGTEIANGTILWLENNAVVLIVKGSYGSFFINGDLIYEGNDLLASGTTNRIVVFGNHNGASGAFDDFKFWKLDGADIP